MVPQGRSGPPGKVSGGTADPQCPGVLTDLHLVLPRFRQSPAGLGRVAGV